jgi:hypothetical protein
MKNAHLYAQTMAVELLRGIDVLTEENIKKNVAKITDAIKHMELDGTVDQPTLVAELLNLFSITVGRASALDDNFNHHQPWLDSRRAEIIWSFWDRYQKYLIVEKKWAPKMVESIDYDTDMVLERIEDPQRFGAWDRRGMVVGSVQSGKTANYIGLINKALDVGYKLIIVLAGIHSNLRSQTQIRIDEGVIGFDTQKSRKLAQDNRWIGVGQTPGPRLRILALTNSAENGDFNLNSTPGLLSLGGDPVILVVKKNSRVLKNLLAAVLPSSVPNTSEKTKRQIKDVPLLLIDDEADNASINVKVRNDEDEESNRVSAINGRIRELLSSFEKAAYIGYTATPFANIFINPDTKTEKHDDDIFPRSFIINIKPPSNYIGPTNLFGIDGDDDSNIKSEEGIPIIRTIEDAFEPGAFPIGHKKDHIPIALPPSLHKSIRVFLLAAAARHARGQSNKHCSMLIHVTRFVAVQERVATLVSADLKSLKERIANGDGGRKPSLVDELKLLWESDFVQTTVALGLENVKCVTWENVLSSLYFATSKVTVATINGYAKEALDYKEYESVGRNVIAIGGDKLSRGLTLEGLTVSYFLRTTRMYDTLMQMGRWFGYRPGYLDLCRLYTTTELIQWYRHIALAETELRREFDYMAKAGLTPENYGLRVRTHPGGLMITALNKMGWNQRTELACDGRLIQTAHLPKDARIQRNAARTESFLNELNVPSKRLDKRALVWREVSGDSVAEYLMGMEYPIHSMRMAGTDLASFIRKLNQQEELINWTVVLLSNSQIKDPECREFASHRIGLLRRSPASQTACDYSLPNNTILSPRDESIDLSDLTLTKELADTIVQKPGLTIDERAWILNESLSDPKPILSDIALALTIRRIAQRDNTKQPPTQPSIPSGIVIRELRPKTNGLLLIYPLEQPERVQKLEMNGVVMSPEVETGLEPSGPPVIGLTLSFPSSESATRVEYQVNKRWNRALVDEGDSDDD